MPVITNSSITAKPAGLIIDAIVFTPEQRAGIVQDASHPTVSQP